MSILNVHCGCKKDCCWSCGSGDICDDLECGCDCSTEKAILIREYKNWPEDFRGFGTNVKPKRQK